MSSIYKIAAALILFSLAACSHGDQAVRSFCYWNSSLDFSEKDDSTMQSMKVKHLYLRFFDVDWNAYEKEALPVGTISSWWDGEIGDQDITPAIYITNTVMENSTSGQLDELAARIRSRIEKIIENFSAQYASRESWEYRNLSYDSRYNKDSILRIADSVEQSRKESFLNRFREVLIDCDWTEKTKKNYFYFLEQLKAQPGKKYTLSATVRLWQYKERKKAGVPPSDRILLMCYNTQSPASYATSNSIASPKLIGEYLDAPAYPVKTDVALPIFSWSILFREQHFEGILSDITDADCLSDTASFRQIKSNFFAFRHDTIIGNKYIRTGDELRIEKIQDKDMERIISAVSIHVDLDKDSKITFFSWNKNYIRAHGTGNLNSYYESFNN
jgi:hypothetical protein